ncbi:riboflavin synthase [Treponema sp.]|uniref:riboflavin synthase n=1 Tax=Treponema sp. TaxID=166 RepID=UPI003F036D80
MFTGIVEGLGTVKNILRSGHSFSIEIQAPFFEGLVLGESIAVNGVCLTVAEFSGNVFTADVTPETFSRTSLKNLRTGSCVNLERAMKADGRFGGHIVSGHIDGTGRILSCAKEENAVNVQFSMEKKLGEFMVEKGSLAVDGISLTVASVKWSGSTCVVTAAVIPHTWSSTVLSRKRPGDIVNIECDIVGKYIRHFTLEVKNEG